MLSYKLTFLFVLLLILVFTANWNIYFSWGARKEENIERKRETEEESLGGNEGRRVRDKTKTYFHLNFCSWETHFAQIFNSWKCVERNMRTAKTPNASITARHPPLWLLSRSDDWRGIFGKRNIALKFSSCDTFLLLLRWQYFAKFFFFTEKE